MTVIEEIAAERKRQIEVEGWTPEYDDKFHADGELAKAAAAYAWASTKKHPSIACTSQIMANIWPWHWSWFKPKNPRRDLIRAAALTVAEIERLDRAAKARVA